MTHAWVLVGRRSCSFGPILGDSGMAPVQHPTSLFAVGQRHWRLTTALSPIGTGAPIFRDTFAFCLVSAGGVQSRHHGKHVSSNRAPAAKIT